MALSALETGGPIIARRFAHYASNGEYRRVWTVPNDQLSGNANYNHYVGITFTQTNQDQATWDDGAGSVFSYTTQTPEQLEAAITIRYTRVGDDYYAQLWIGESGIGQPTKVDRAHVQLRIKVYNPLGTDPVKTYSFQREAGQPIAIALGTNAATEMSVARLQEIVNDESAKPSPDWVKYQANLLALTGMKYWLAKNTGQARIASLTGSLAPTPIVEVGIASSEALSTGNFVPNPDFINRRIYAGLKLDIPGAIADPELLAGNAAKDQDLVDENAYNAKQSARALMHFNASALESSIIEEVANGEAVSTVKAMVWAAALDRPFKRLSDFEVNYQPFVTPVAAFADWAKHHAFGPWYTAADNAIHSTSTTTVQRTHAQTVIDLIDKARSQIEADILGHRQTPDPLGDAAKNVVVPDVVIDLFDPDNASGWTGVTWIREKMPTGDVPEADPRHWAPLKHPRSEGYVILRAGDGTADGGGLGPVDNSTGDLNPWSALEAPRKGDPVNSSTGALNHSESDVSIARPGLPLSFARLYDSGRARDSVDIGIGNGWSHTYSERMKLDGPAGSRRVTWVTATGDSYEFTEGNGSFKNPTGVYGRLELAGSGPTLTFTYHEKDGGVRVFGEKGQLREIRDRNANELHVSYKSIKDDIFRISKVVSIDAAAPADESHKLTFTTSKDGHVVSVEDFTGRNWSYVYDTDPAGTTRLGSTTLPDGRGKMYQKQTYCYTYYQPGESGAGLLRATERWINKGKKAASGNALRGETSFAYYPNGRVFSTSDAVSHVEYFRYDMFTSFALPRQPGPSGYGSAGPIFDTVTSQDRQPRTRWTTHTDYDGNASTTVFNDDGLAVRELLPSRDRIETTYVNVGDSGDAGVVDTVKDQVGLTEAFRYDLDGNVTTHVQNSADFDRAAAWPEGVVTKYTYNGFAQVLTEQVESEAVSGTQRLTTSTYDGHGNLHTVTDPESNVTTYSDYLDNGLPQTMTPPLGATPASDTDRQVHYAYLDTTLDDGRPGRLIETSRRARVGGPVEIVAQTYDLRGNLVKTSDAASHVIRYQYDELDRLLSTSQTVNGVHITNASDYDDGLLHSTRSGLGYHTIYGYDANRRQTSVTTPDGSSSATQYDGLGQPVTATDPLGNETTTFYDADGRVIEVLRADGSYALTTYDGLGRVVAAQQSVGTNDGYGLGWLAVATNQYGSDGFLASETAATGYRTAYTHDPFGEVSVEQHFDFSTTATPASSTPYLTVRYTRDALGRVIGRRGDDKVVERTTYDGRGNVVATTRYDVTNRTAASIASPSFDFAVVANDPQRVVQTVYDLEDRPLAVSDPSGVWTRTYMMPSAGCNTRWIFAPVPRRPLRSSVAAC